MQLYENTIVSIEMDGAVKACHFLAYGYLRDIVPVGQLVEFTGFYLPLEQVIREGFDFCEVFYGDDYKQYVSDYATEQDLNNCFIQYDNGNAPPILRKTDLNMDTPFGVYIMV